MRNLILQMQLSVDGFVADSTGGVGWLTWNFGDNWTWMPNYSWNLTAFLPTSMA